VIGDKHIASGEKICLLQKIGPIYANNFATGQAQSLEDLSRHERIALPQLIDINFKKAQSWQSQ